MALFFKSDRRDISYIPNTKHIEIEADKYYAIDDINRFYTDRVLRPTEDGR